MSRSERAAKLIRLREVTRSYTLGAAELRALDSVSLDIPAGGFVVVLGRSGSGKSTLVNMVAGLDRPTAGTIHVGSAAIHALNEDELALWRGTHVGVVFQFFQLLPTLTVAENVALPMDFCGRCGPVAARERALTLLASVGIAEQADKLPTTLSGGQQQRVAIARALAVPGRIDTVRTYPDRAHGSLIVLAPPPKTRLISFPPLAGRWLQPGDDDGVVLNHVAAAQRAGARVGDRLTVSAEGATARVRVVGIVEEIGAAGVVYMSRSAFEARFGAPRLARLTTTSNSGAQRSLAITAIEQELTHAGASVQVVMSFTELRTAVGDHVVVLVNALIALAAVLGCVGLLGLSSSMTTAVVERTREIGVMKAMGAVRRRILSDILAEGVLTAGLSAALALLLALPLAALVEAHLGRLGFLAPLPFVVSLSGAALWTGLVLVASVLATWLPARRAAAISVREAIAHV